jgi:hypothetical protein
MPNSKIMGAAFIGWPLFPLLFQITIVPTTGCICPTRLYSVQPAISRFCWTGLESSRSEEELCHMPSHLIPSENARSRVQSVGP